MLLSRNHLGKKIGNVYNLNIGAARRFVMGCMHCLSTFQHTAYVIGPILRFETCEEPACAQSDARGYFGKVKNRNVDGYSEV